jgi:two-component system response regulator QseB
MVIIGSLMQDGNRWLRLFLHAVQLKYALVYGNVRDFVTSVTERTGLPILVVDDDEPTLNLLRAVLKRCGYGTDVASNGNEAIALLRKNDYAAIVLDMMMPHVGGPEVIAFLSANASPIPVVICSAAGPSALAGFDTTIVKAVIRKPFDIDELTAAVQGIKR